MFDKIKAFFTEEPSHTLPDNMTEEEWQELLERARRADRAYAERMKNLKKNDPKKYRAIKSFDKFTMGM
jgi:hypothetical protein